MTTTDDLFAAIDAGQSDQVTALLDAEPALAGSHDKDGVSALMHALYHHHPPIAEALAARLGTVDVFEAAGLGRADAVERLVQADESLANAWSVDGFTALHFAAYFGNGATATALLDVGADPEARSRNSFKVMPIHSAVAGRRSDVVAVLLENDADPNVRQEGGWTPLHG